MCFIYYYLFILGRIHKWVYDPLPCVSNLENNFPNFNMWETIFYGSCKLEKENYVKINCGELLVCKNSIQNISLISVKGQTWS